MFYFALKDMKEGVVKKLKDELGDPNNISVRGYNLEEVKLPSELSGRLLPVNLLASQFCPTNRDIFLKCVRKVSETPNWSSCQGRAIHNLCFRIFDCAGRYVSRRNMLQKIDLFKYINHYGTLLMNELSKDIEHDISRMRSRPSGSERDRFLKNLSMLKRMQSEIASTLIDYTIATNTDVQLDSEFRRLFPFQREISLNATPLGFSKGVKPDFVYPHDNEIVMGDIKTGEVKDFHKLVVAAYALAYEFEENVPVNFGVILNIKFSNNRKVPIYKDTDAFIISDKYRKAFLDLRDQKFSIVKNGPEPDLATEEACAECVYSPHCRGNQT